MTNIKNQLTDDIEFRELLPLIEFGCWTAIALFPFLYWVNGPAVSTDQYVMRSILIGIAVVGAFGIRFWNWRSKRRPETDGAGEVTEKAAKSSDKIAQDSKYVEGGRDAGNSAL